MVLTVVLIMSSACITVYGNYAPYAVPNDSSVEKYVFSTAQGASYLLDLLDGILADAELNFTWDDLGAGSYIGAVNFFVDPDLPSSLNLSSIDNATATVVDLIATLQAASGGLTGAILGLFDVLGDIPNLTSNGLSKGVLRTTMGITDMDVLMMYIKWLDNNKDVLASIVAGTFNFGALDSAIPDMLMNLDGFLQDTLYSLLLNGDAETGTGTTDNALQQLVNWALIEGTGSTPATGSESLLGADFEPLLPSLATYGTVTPNAMGTGIGSGTYYQAASLKNISFYQLVNNVVNAALGSLIVPLLTDLLLGAFDVELTEEFPGGDPAKMTDPIFALVVGLVETLATDNGADPPDYTAEDNATPLAKITALLNWFILDGGMDNFILFDNTGLHITDAFVSLLGDLIRLLVNMFDDFGLGQVNGGYTSQELNENYYYIYDDVAGEYVCVPRSQGGEQIGVTYITLETQEKVAGPANALVNSEGKYILYKDAADDQYKFLGTAILASDYAFNMALIRENRVVTVNDLFAYAVSVLLNKFVPGCYFPKEAKTIAEVGAYALAALAAKILPNMNFLEQLDANYKSCCIASGGTWNDATGTGTYLDSDSQVVTPLTFITHEQVVSGGVKYDYYVPVAVLKIASCIGAYYLNGILEATFTIDSDVETFCKELIVWGAERYLPILTGKKAGSGASTTYTGGVFAAAFQSFARGTINIYQLLDNTVFKLIPASWLPTKYANAPASKGTTYTIIYEWLFGSLRTIDLQKLISLFTVNTSPNAELNQPVLTVVLRLVDRVLALVLNGNALLPPYNRNTINAVYATNTTITSLDSLLLGNAVTDPLPSLVKYLLQYLNTSAGISGSTDTIAKVLLTTLLPLLLQTDYQKPYRAEVLGANPTIGIEDLKVYTDEINHLNSIYDEETDTYTPINFVEAGTTKTFSNASDYTIIQRTTENPNGTPMGRDVYSGFGNSSYVPATSSTKRGTYNGNYVFYEAEDYGMALYRFNNANDTDKRATEFVGSYENFYKHTMSNYYGDWSRYFINRRLYQAGLYDANGDGTVAADEGAPGIPGTPYPYYVSTSSVITYKEGVTDKSFNVNTLKSSNYETIRLALANAALPETRVKLTTGDANAVVRLALGLAPSAFTGEDYSTLTSAQIATLTSFCAGLGYTYDTTGETPCITRPAFATIGSVETGASVSSAPPTTKPGDDTVADYALSRAMYNGVVDYYKALIAHKQGLFNIYDEMNYRRELAEAGGIRNTMADTTQLQWALRKFEPQYYTGVRNAQGGVDKGYGRNVALPAYINGTLTYNKVYTAASYAKFQAAYDLATDLVAAARNQQGIPQSFVTKVRAMLLDAYYGLIPFTGAADYALLDEYVARAQAIINETLAPDYDPDTGYYEDGLSDLSTVLSSANSLLTQAINGEIDCEANEEIAGKVMSLMSAIESLEYKISPDLEEIINGYSLIKDTQLSQPNNQRGYIYNLKEGEGLTTTEKVGLIGLRLDDNIGNTMVISETRTGRGTGSYIRGGRKNVQVFRYYAVLYGDVNGDARIDGTDKNLVEYNIICDGALTNEGYTFQSYQIIAADTNRDGTVDADDVALVQSRVDQPANMNVIDQSSTVTN